MPDEPLRCLPPRIPLIVRERGLAGVRTPAELVTPVASGPAVQVFEPGRVLDAWDGAIWTAVTSVAAVRRDPGDPAQAGLCLQGRAAILHVTAGTGLLDAAGGMLLAADAAVGAKLRVTADFPPPGDWSALTPETGELLGHLAGAAATDAAGTIRYSHPELAARTRVAELWSRCFGGAAAEQDDDVALHAGAGHLGAWLHEQLTSAAGRRRVPPIVLNATAEVAESFLAGYDTPADVKRASLRTPSAVLTQGICWLHALQGRKPSVFVEHEDDGESIYQLDPRPASPFGQVGVMVPPVDPATLRGADPWPATPTEWLFDVRTESGKLVAGVGRAVIAA